MRRRHAWRFTKAVGGGGGSVPVVSAVSYGVVDTAGGGQRVVVTVDDSTGATGIKSDTGGGEVAWTSFSIVNGTTVKGIPGAHAAGTVDVVVTNATGDSTTGTGLIEYWTPAQITGIDAYLDSNKGVTDAGAGAVSQWDDQSSNAYAFAQGTGANRPVQTAAVFGTLPSINFTPQEFVRHTGRIILASGLSMFWVGKWASGDTAEGQAGVNSPLTIVSDFAGNEAMNVGASGGALAVGMYDGAWAVKTKGSGLNDGTTRLVGWTVDPASVTHKAYSGVTQVGTTGTTGGTYAAVTGYDCIGCGFNTDDGWDGDVGAVIVVSGVISGADLTKTHKWAQQRFGAA